MSNSEQDIRLDIYNAMIEVPHFSKRTDAEKREWAEKHMNFYAQDPMFYAHLAVWYMDNGTVRDHKILFVATLLKSSDMDHRDAGFVLLKDMEPYIVATVVEFLKKFYGGVPRSTKTAVKQYLRAREGKDSWFDRGVLRQRKAFKSLYASLRIKPSARANAILFEDNPPEDSILYMLKSLAKAKGSQDQAEIIARYKIPYTVAVGAVTEKSPAVLAALVSVMSPQEVINNLKSLKSDGAMDNDDVRALVNEKLEKAKSGKRVTGSKAKIAADAAGVDEETRQKLEEVTDQQARSKGSIKRPTALLVDKSGSLSVAIEVGKRVAQTVGGIAENDFYVYAFDRDPFPIVASGKGVSDWEKAFRHVIAQGGTSVGCGFAALAANRQFVEQVIVVTDEKENATPYADEAYRKYCQAMNVQPDVAIVRVGAFDRPYVTDKLEAAGATVNTWQFKGDYYAVDNLIGFLSKPSRLELLLEIMAVPLPVREDVTRPEPETATA